MFLQHRPFLVFYTEKMLYRILFTRCHNHILVLSPVMTYHQGLLQEKHNGCHMWIRNFLQFNSNWVHPLFLVGFVLLDL